MDLVSMYKQVMRINEQLLKLDYYVSKWGKSRPATHEEAYNADLCKSWMGAMRGSLCLMNESGTHGIEGVEMYLEPLRYTAISVYERASGYARIGTYSEAVKDVADKAMAAINSLILAFNTRKTEGRK